MRWTTNKTQSDYMRDMVRKNLAMSLNNRAENWAAARLKATKLGWKRQAQFRAIILRCLGYSLMIYFGHDKARMETTSLGATPTKAGNQALWAHDHIDHDDPRETMV